MLADTGKLKKKKKKKQIAGGRALASALPHALSYLARSSVCGEQWASCTMADECRQCDRHTGKLVTLPKCHSLPRRLLINTANVLKLRRPSSGLSLGGAEISSNTAAVCVSNRGGDCRAPASMQETIGNVKRGEFRGRLHRQLVEGVGGKLLTHVAGPIQRP